MQHNNILNTITTAFSPLPQLKALVLAGSATAEYDALSDYDLYAYISSAIPLEKREEIAGKFSDRYEINNQFWETGDEWVCRDSGKIIDIMYRDPGWISDEMEQVVFDHRASLGYSTCLWYNVLNSQILYDPENWFAKLQQRVNIPYPAQLQKNIIAKNYPVLCRNLSAYLSQIKKALQRADVVSIQHRITAFLASYFDIIFALNKVAHPGEKRLLSHVQQSCKIYPENMISTIQLLISGDLKFLQSDAIKLISELCRDLTLLLERFELMD